MKLLGLLALSALCPAVAVSRAASSPIMELVTMIQKIKAKIEAEGKAEQKSYDKYACWCERTMDKKAEEMAKAKLRIKALIKLIKKISMEIGICTAEMDANSKDVVNIKAAIKTLVEQR